MRPRRKMSKTRKLFDHIPLDIQSEIIKRLPVKSLLQFRSVSKQWKSFIDDPKFIKNYHVNHANSQHRLLVCNTVQNYTSIIDNNTFPKQKFSLTAPESLNVIGKPFLLSSGDGLLCFYDRFGVDIYSDTRTVVIWNPTVRKSIRIVISVPQGGYINKEYVVVGFGVCPDTRDPKLVKINHDKISNMWVVEVFTLSTRIWRTVYTGTSFKSCRLTWFQVFVDGVIYFHAFDEDLGSRSANLVISFDLKSEKFGEVCLPERLVHTRGLEVTKVNESLGLLEYYNEGYRNVCGVWSRKDGNNNQFTKIYTIKVEVKWLDNWVLGFRNNGEAVMARGVYYNDSRIEVYEPSSGHIKGVGINGKRGCLFCVTSYTETLLLLDESCSIIHKKG